MAFLPRLGRSLETKDAATRRQSAGGRYLGGGKTQQPYKAGDWSIERATTDAFERVIWAYRAIDAIADQAARLRVVAREGDPDDGVEVEDPLVTLLNRKPNDHDRAYAFRYRLSTQLLLSKQGAYVEVIRDRAKRVSRLHLLPPHMTHPIPNPDKFLAGFMVEIPGEEPKVLRPDQVLWIRKPHPLDPYMGTTPLEAAGLSIDMDFYARLYNRNFMANDGRPGGLISVRGRLNQEDAAELKSRFRGGPGNAGRATVIEADDVSWVDTATSPRDAQYTESRASTKEEILLAFGVPESVIGNASGRTYDNADAEKEIFWHVTMLPHLHLIATAFDDLLGDGAMDDVHLGYDLADVDVLRRAERARHDKLRSEYNDGLITLDEYREETGRDPIDVAATRSLWLPGGRTAIGTTPEDQFEVSQLTSGMPLPDPNAPATPEGEGGMDPTDPGSGGQPPGDPGAPAALDRGASPDEAVVYELPYDMAAELKALGRGDADGQLWPHDLSDEELDAVILGTKTLEELAREVVGRG